jgi:outer membrane protein assembly factor BamB
VFRRRKERVPQAHEETSSAVSYEVAPIEPAERQRSLPARAIFNAITIVVVVTLIAVSVPLWLGPARQLWMRLFPPPPYAGSLFYTLEENGGDFIARRTTDGSVQWRLKNTSQETFSVSDGGTIYDFVSGQHLLRAIRPRDGHIIWQSRVSIQNTDYVAPIGFDQAAIYLWDVHAATTQTGPVLAFDKQGGQLSWTSPDASDALIDAASRSLLLCNITQIKGSRETLALTTIDLSTKAQRWNHTLTQSNSPSVGWLCGLTPTRAYGTLSQGQPFASAVSTFDLQTGAFVWQKLVAGSLSGADRDLLYFSTALGNQAGAGQLIAIQMADGSQRWSAPAGAYDPAYFFASGTPAIGKALVLHAPDELAAIDTQTGAFLWALKTTAVDPSGNQWDIEQGDGNVVYYEDASGLYAVDALSGRINWKSTDYHYFEISAGFSTLHFDRHQLYVIQGLRLSALDPSTGVLRWQQAIDPGASLCTTC